MSATIKLVLSKSWDGFSLSREALDRLNTMRVAAGLEIFQFYWDINDRTDPNLVSIVEELGKGAGELVIVELPQVYKNYYTIRVENSVEYIDLKLDKLLQDTLNNLDVDDLSYLSAISLLKEIQRLAALDVTQPYYFFTP